MGEEVARIEQVWKSFVVRHNRTESLKQLFISWLDFRRRERREVMWVLEGVDMVLRRGETVGLIGPNGSGKSTLLRLISGILYPERGKVTVQGRVAPMIELGVGFHPELTGEENLHLNASLYGLTRRQVEALIDDIVEFAELKDFIDVPIRNYSTGMQIRLGFSIAVHLKPDLLLVDEVLAVGDEAFQSQCLERMRVLKADGVSILFVSHDLKLVETMCDRIYWIQAGKVAYAGNPELGVARYRAQQPEREDEGSP